MSQLGGHTKYHRLGGLNSTDSVSHSSGGYKSEIKVPSGLASGLLNLSSCPVGSCRRAVSSHGLPAVCPCRGIFDVSSSSFTSLFL